MKQIVHSVTLCRFKLAMRGYGFCKLIPVTSLNNEFNHIVHVYDYFTRDNFVSRHLSSIITKHDFLFDPVPIQLPSIERGFGSWKKIGELSAENIFIPEYKYTPNNMIMNEHDIKEWYIFCAIKNKKKRAINYDAIKHLEHFHIYNHDELSVKTTMEILKREGKKISMFFDLKNISHLNNYFRTMNKPIYADIPIYMRGNSTNTDNTEVSEA